MTPDKLLDAIGMLDDRHFEAEKIVRITPWRRRLIALIAAVLMIALSVGAATAVSPEFRELIFSIFNIETHETPPAATVETTPSEENTVANVHPEENTEPSQSGLQEIDVVSIDGIVHAHYFTSGGIVLTYEGGFYTCSYSEPDTVLEDAAFWEIHTNGVMEIDATRIEFPLNHGNRTFQIIFDYAILNGKLCIRVWPQNMNQDPIGNGWNLEAIGKRTDVALLTVPVHTDDDYSHDLLLLDLTTLETKNLLESISYDHVTVYGCRITDDLHYAILMGNDKETGYYGYWLCDLELNTITTLDIPTEPLALEPYFLNDSTLIFQETIGKGRFNVVSRHIPTGVENVMIENTTSRSRKNPGYRGIQKHGGYGAHCLLFQEDGTVDLIDLRTGSDLNMTGLDMDKLTTSESPDGSRIFIAYEETNKSGELGYGFSQFGILNPETGVLHMLTRDVSGNPETFWGWLDNDTVVITARDAAGGYYVYVYEFQEPPV